MQKYLLTFLAFSTFISCTNKNKIEIKSVDYTKFVNPFIGTDGTGHTFPGPTMPFGMVQPGPDNTDKGWDYTSGYQLKDSIIIGFSNTRASGTGISEFGDILLFPFTQIKSDFSSKKVTEKAEVGYYKVNLSSDITAELTSSERVAFHKYTYPSNDAKLFLNLQHGLLFLTDSLVLDSNVIIENDKQTISGYCHTKNWVARKYFFTVKFDFPFKTIEELSKQPKEKAPKYILTFDLKEKQLQCKVALSKVSIGGAKNNLITELPHWEFNQVKQNAKKVWNNYLKKIEIEADDNQKTIFYTAMYHLFIQPSNIADVDGKYRGADDKIAKAINNEYYSTLSLWDTYRGAHPLYTILVPERVNGFVNTMLAHHKAQGYLPIWTAWGQENHCMIGNHAIPVIVDAHMKGFDGFNKDEALSAMVSSSTKSHLNSDWETYNKFGYYPFDYLDNESVSRTLESGFDDYCVALMANDLGKNDIAETFKKRASYYKNLFDFETGLMRGKDSNGKFRFPFRPLEPTSPMNNPGDYTEANAWQYAWTPSQHDIEDYTKLLGGKAQLKNQLNTFFTIKSEEDNKHLGQEGLIGQYAHGNEPSHHIAYLYAFTDEPKIGRDYISQIYKQFYSEKPNGITGNDDCGQMSAWYIFTTLGFYPVNPANGAFVFGIPQVHRAILNLTNTKTLVINLQNKNFKEIRFNNKLLQTSINYTKIMQGGNLVFK
jgi:predicted alpha-1,2-mannosidase